MRIRSLRLQEYGHFIDSTVEFGDEVTVVAGPNEAGKSTLLDGLGDFLWGIQSNRHPRAFRHHKPGIMALSAEVVSDGEQRTYVRRLGKVTQDGEEVEPPWRGDGMQNADRWLSMFGLDCDRLQEGGREVIAGKGELADLIFLAETGQALLRIRDALHKRSEQIHRVRGANDIKALLDEIEELGQRIDETEASAGEVADLRAQIEGLVRQRDQLLEERNEVERTVLRNNELTRCLPLLRDLDDLETDIADLADAGTVLSEGDTSALRDALEKRDSSVDALEEVRGKIRKDRRALEDLNSPPEVLAARDQITSLQQSLEARKADQRLLASEAELQNAVKAVREVLRSVGRSPGDDLARDVHAAVLADGVRDRLTRLAADVLSARAKEAEQQETVAQWEADGEASGHEDPGTAVLLRARTDRDAAWRAVRDPWLRGELPDPDARKDMANQVDRTIIVADEAAEQMAEQLEAVAQIRGAAEQRAKQLDLERQRLERLATDAAALAQQWDQVCAASGLPAGLDAEAWQLHDKRLSELTRLWADVEDLQEQRDQALSRWEEFRTLVAELDALPAEAHTDPLRRVEAVAVALDQASKDRARAEEIERHLAERVAREAELITVLEEATARIKELTADEEDSAEQLLARSESMTELRGKRETAMASLRVAKEDGSSLDEVMTALRATDEVELKSQAMTASTDREGLDDRIGALDGELGRLRGDLSDLESRGSASQLHAVRVAKGEQLRGLVEEYRMLRVQIELVDAFTEELSKANDSPLLAEAAAHLRALTNGRYSGFQVVEDGASRAIEVALPGDTGETLKLDELSAGTADQVFLALRLAGISAKQRERTAAGLPTLPVVLDDVLVDHDDERTRAALEVFARLGSDMQIIVLTHHGSVAQAASEIPGITCVDLVPG